MNDDLINAFKEIFDLTPTQRSLVQSAFFGAFFCISFIYFLFSSRGIDPINKIGYKNGMVFSLIICGLGCLSFYPAALMNSYWAFLSALFILASGVTCLQICANPYATILGDPESASGRLNKAQGLNSMGTTVGPIIGAILIWRVFSDGSLDAFSVGKTYLIYGVVFLALALMVWLAKLPAFVNTEKIEPGLKVLKNKHLTLGILAIFFYVGSEVSVGSWIVEFIQDEKIMGLDTVEAHYYLAYFWGGLMIGRLMASFSLNDEYSKQKKNIYMAITSMLTFFFIYIITSLKNHNGEFTFEPLGFSSIYLYLICMVINYAAFLVGKGKPGRSLVIFSSLNMILLLIAINSSGQLAFWSIIATGLFFSIGWSNIFALAIAGLGKYTSQGSSLLVMAIVGGAVLPKIQSHIIEAYSVQTSFIIPVIGMIYLIYYGLSGHKIKTIT